VCLQFYFFEPSAKYGEVFINLLILINTINFFFLHFKFINLKYFSFVPENIVSLDRHLKAFLFKGVSAT